MLQDIRFALRLLARNRGYAGTAILTVALGVGANTAIFSIADSVLFRPLPFADADRLFVLRISDVKTKQTFGFLPASAVDAARASGLFDGIGGAEPRDTRIYVRGTDGLDALYLTPVSREYLALLGVRPLLGRPFDASDTGTRTVLLSHRTWLRQYGGDPGVIGRVIPAAVRTMDVSRLPDAGFRIVGVLPPRLRLPLFPAADGMTLLEETGRGGRSALFTPLVRLKPGVTPGVAEAQLSGVQGEELVPGKTALRLVPVREEMAFRQDPVLWLLLGAAAIVLLVACVNLANLILARGSARGRELAVRAALGGSRGRLIRLLVVEALSIATLGTAAGLLAAYVGFSMLADQLPPLLARVTDPAFDVRVLVFAIAVAAVSAVAFSVVPALRLSRADARVGLGLGRMLPNAPRRGRGLLVGLELAICVTSLVGAALVGRSLVALLSQDLGFDSRRVAVTFDLPTLVVRRGEALRADTPARAAFFQARLRDVRAVPGVRAAGVATAAPFSGIAPDAQLTEGSVEQGGGVFSVSSGYFRAIGVPLLAGRDLTDEESFAAAPVGVLNDTAARAICGTPAACLGRVVHSPKQPARTVVGVVGDTRPSLRRAAIPAMYVPFDVNRFAIGSLVIDSDDAPATRDALKRALAASPDARVQVRSLDDARALEVAPFRFNATIVGAFAILTLALAVVGVYGVMTAVVGERTREYGIRVALGATRQVVNRQVLRQAAVPIVAGIAGGLVLAGWAARYLASLLYEIVPLDTPSFAVAAALVLACALVAAFVPARRAGRVDPIIALRAE
jgi:putative ABC transport system permease protein